MKKLYVLSLLLVLSLFLFGCSNSNKEANVVEEIVQEDLNENTSKASDVTKNECMQGCKIMRKSNESNKERSDSEMDKDCNNLCEATQGMQNRDTDSCEKSEGVLRDACYTDIAKAKKDPSLCEKIADQTMMGSCYTLIAEIIKDPTLCNNVKGEMREDICIQGAQK